MRISEAVQQVVAIYPGRFHPFHKGHVSVYEYLKAKYKNVYIATSDKVGPPKSPFTFAEKKMMMVHAGVPANAIVQTKNPYQAQEILENFDPANTAVVFAVSEKDMDEDPRFSFKPKKDGSPSYFQPIGKDLATFDKHGYITTVPTLDFDVLGEPMRSATQLRANFAKADEKTQKQMIIDLYGQYDANIHNVMQSKITEFHNMEQDYNRIQEVAKRIWALDVQRPLSEDVKRTAISNIKLATEAWKNRYTKQYNEALSLPPEADAKWLEKQIRASARKNGIDPNVAVRVWKSEGGMSYQSQIPRKGKGSMGGKEASYGPFQLYTGGGLGNEYENEYGVDLTQDNTLSGLQRQINFAMNKASQGGWSPWYGAAKAGIGYRDGIDAPFNVKRRKVSTTSPDSNSEFGTAFKKARAKHGGAGGKFSHKGKEYQTNVKGEKYVTNPVSVDEADVKPHGDFDLDDIAPELRPAVRQAMVRFPMAKDRISAVIRMMQQDSLKQKKNIKNIDRLDTENDIQDVEIDTSEQDIIILKNKIADLEKRLASVKESMIKEGVGRIVKGVNTTQDVGVNQTSIEAAKFGSKLKNGKPPLLHKKALKNSDPNTLSNLGLAEEKINERGGISVPISSGLSVPIAPHRQLKIKKSTKGRHFYENPKKSNRTKSNRGDTI